MWLCGAGSKPVRLLSCVHPVSSDKYNQEAHCQMKRIGIGKTELYSSPIRIIKMSSQPTPVAYWRETHRGMSFLWVDAPSLK